MKMLTTTLVFILVFLTCRLSAQPNPCDAVLIPDVTVRNNSLVWIKSMVNIFRSEQIETYEDYVGFLEKSTALVGGIPLISEMGLSKENFHQFKQDLFRYESLDETLKVSIREKISKLSYYVVKAWQDCNSSNALGTKFWILQGADPMVFTLAGVYRGPGNHRAHLEKVEFSEAVTTRGGSFTNDRLVTNTRYGWRNSIQYQIFRRTSKKELEITISVQEENLNGLHHRLEATNSPISTTKIVLSDGELNAMPVLKNTGTVIDYEGRQTHTNFQKLPYEFGPHVGLCWASTYAKLIPTVSGINEYSAMLSIVNVCGGRAGGFGTGGEAWVTPVYKTTITLPDFLDEQTDNRWNISFRAMATLDEGNANNGEGQNVKVVLDGNGTSKTFEFPFKARNTTFEYFNVTGLSPGNYDLHMFLPSLGRGCAGAPEGTMCQTRFETSLKIDIINGARELAAK